MGEIKIELFADKAPGTVSNFLAYADAGFYNGKIDGVKGEQTKKAIKAFQKANGLRDDGVVGPKTWELLNGYLSGAAAAPAGGSSGSAE